MLTPHVQCPIKKQWSASLQNLKPCIYMLLYLCTCVAVHRSYAPADTNQWLLCPTPCPTPYQACSAKFHPIMQWFYFDALEALPEDTHEFPEDAVTASGSRYEAQVAVFGADFQKKLERTKCFMVSTVYIFIGDSVVAYWDPCYTVHVHMLHAVMKTDGSAPTQSLTASTCSCAHCKCSY